jgi:hypothetical protein
VRGIYVLQHGRERGFPAPLWTSIINKLVVLGRPKLLSDYPALRCLTTGSIQCSTMPNDRSPNPCFSTRVFVDQADGTIDHQPISQ